MDLNKAFAGLPPFICNDVPMTERRIKWQTWKRGFEICLRAGKINAASEKKDLLLAYGGFELQEVFFGIPDADVVESDTVNPYAIAIAKLDEFFAPQRHEAHERFLFWNMKPESDESLGKFLMRTQMHAKKCNFGKSAVESSGIAVIDKMLQFVPAQLREKLLQDKDLTVDEVIRQVNAYETTRSASQQMSGQNITPALKSSENLQRIVGVCKFCGGDHKQDQQCPAWNRTCSNCGKKGHFRRVCFSRGGSSSSGSSFNNNPDSGARRFVKRPHAQAFTGPSAGPSTGSKQFRGNSSYRPRRLHAINEAEELEERVELVEMVSSANDTDELVWAKVGNVMIEMQIDSGVQSNIIDDKTWYYMEQNGVAVIGELKNPDKKFKAYAQQDCLEVDLMFDAEIVICDGARQLKTIARFYVVKRGPQPLLGKETAKRLGVLRVGLPSQHEIIQQISAVQRFPSIRGVKIHIPIDKSMEPVAQRLRRLPFSSLLRVEDKLVELLSKDIIEKVMEPSRWVSPLVVVQKDNGDIRLCIDLRQLNKAVIRETHPLPTMEDVRWRLNGAVYFTRLDIKDAFHQLELDDESKPLTTFITHKGKRCLIIAFIGF